jgi:hypothetical protein
MTLESGDGVKRGFAALPDHHFMQAVFNGVRSGSKALLFDLFIDPF